ncbi:hypothetical protein D3C85_1509280 [compost metagenome]
MAFDDIVGVFLQAIEQIVPKVSPSGHDQPFESLHGTLDRFAALIKLWLGSSHKCFMGGVQ